MSPEYKGRREPPQRGCDPRRIQLKFRCKVGSPIFPFRTDLMIAQRSLGTDSVPMKSAQEILRELTRYIMPPPGVTIEVSEKPSHEPQDENWLAFADGMDAKRVKLFGEMLAELRRSDRIIDWSAVAGPPGRRKVTAPTAN